MERLDSQPATGTLLWPGVVVDIDGMGIAWPGWVLVGEDWEEVPDDRIPMMVIRFEVEGVTTEETLTYPANRQSCLSQPPGTGLPANVFVMPGWIFWLMVLMMAGIGSRYARRV